MASIRQRQGKWQARVSRQGFPPETKTFATKAEAEVWARSVESGIDKGTHQSRNSLEAVTVAEVLRRYGEEVSPLKKGAKAEAIRLAAVARSKLGKYSLANLTPAVMAQWRDERLKRVKAGTVIRDLAVLSSIFNHCRREWGHPFLNPVEQIRKPQMPSGRDRVLSPAEEEALLNEALPVGRRSPWLHPLIVLALETGMRRGELLSLKWENINLAKRTALLPDTKNGSKRIVPLSNLALDTLKGLRSLASHDGVPQIRSDGVIFPISVPALHLRWKAASKRAGIKDLHFHDLRHTAITRMADKLPNVIELSAVTGHKNLQMLKRYYHPSAEALAIKLSN